MTSEQRGRCDLSSATHHRISHDFYRYFAVQGRETLIDTLASVDPFALSPAEVLERVLALGFGPDVTKHPGEMWPTIGRVFEVRRDEQDFLVAIGRDAEESACRRFGPTLICRSSDQIPVYFPIQDPEAASMG